MSGTGNSPPQLEMALIRCGGLAPAGLWYTMLEVQSSMTRALRVIQAAQQLSIQQAWPLLLGWSQARPLVALGYLNLQLCVP